MKFIHLSDLHLGKRVNEYSMLEDQEYILKKIINIVDAEKPDGVIIAGDVYDKSVPAAEAVQSLALGLSDEIQASAGGVKLDTMFVDEGFGSLDEESLDQAMKALSSLADGNRLVGIISHVSDLKNLIDKQIVVEKEKSGESKACIVL